MTAEDVEAEVEELLGELAEYDDLEEMLDDLEDDVEVEFGDAGSLDTVFEDAED